MDIPPTIPTSFVPRLTSSAVRRFSPDSVSMFNIFAYSVLGIVLLLTVSVFSYDRILVGTLATKGKELETSQKAIDLATVQGFIQLRDRLNVGATLLANHVAFSNFFALFETLVPSTIRLSSLHLSFDAAKKVRLDGSGTAKNFNALAAASAAFATDGRFKEAVFSNMAVDKETHTVSFVLSATLDPKVVSFSP